MKKFLIAGVAAALLSARLSPPNRCSIGRAFILAAMLAMAGPDRKKETIYRSSMACFLVSHARWPEQED
jgi:hypothetical protein